MRFWIAQDTNGQITIFTKEPKRYRISDGIYSWAIEGTDASAIRLINHFTAKRYIAEDGNVEYVFLADMIGFKRKGYKDGVQFFSDILNASKHWIDVRDLVEHNFPQMLDVYDKEG